MRLGAVRWRRIRLTDRMAVVDADELLARRLDRAERLQLFARVDEVPGGRRRMNIRAADEPRDAAAATSRSPQASRVLPRARARPSRRAARAGATACRLCGTARHRRIDPPAIGDGRAGAAMRARVVVPMYTFRKCGSRRSRRGRASESRDDDGRCRKMMSAASRRSPRAWSGRRRVAQRARQTHVTATCHSHREYSGNALPHRDQHDDRARLFLATATAAATAHRRTLR